MKHIIWRNPLHSMCRIIYLYIAYISLGTITSSSATHFNIYYHLSGKNHNWR